MKLISLSVKHAEWSMLIRRVQSFSGDEYIVELRFAQLQIISKGPVVQMTDAQPTSRENPHDHDLLNDVANAFLQA